MTKQEKWDQFIFPKLISGFSKRIQHDIITYPKPTKLPDLGSYYIQGPPSSGKTIFAAHMWLKGCKHLFFDDESIGLGTSRFASTPEFLFEMQRAINAPDVDQGTVLDQYADANLLVLDDLGAERSTEWIMSVLYLLFNRRYENMLPTIITSNYTLDELEDKLEDGRITARIRNMCTILEVNITEKK
jgi:DNA replication protein DnaC